jgi:tripartite-type tricarboxylate transporter receptor subunit TctC
MTERDKVQPSVSRRLLMQLFGCAGLALAGMAPGMSMAAEFPERPLRLVVPFPAGGPTDIVARPLAHLLSSELGQPVIVDNRGGAGGSIAADHVAKSAPDGYTMLMGTVGTQAINATLYKSLPYDPMKDFTPLGMTASAPVALVVHADSPYKTVADLIAAAKKNPGKLAFGSAGSGTPGHLTGEMFAKAADVKFLHVPYRGSAPAVSDLLGQQIVLMFDPVQSILPHVASGKLRALAVSSPERSSVLPQTPTVAESGFPKFEAEAWWAVFAPAGLPDDVTNKLRTKVEKVVHSDEFREKLGNLGVAPSAPLKTSFEEFNRAELKKWGKAVKDSGASID